jgi:translocation and assembly module TamB
MDGYVTGSLQLKGPPGNSILLGKLEVEKGAKLYFKDKIFELQTGLVNFANQNEVNPDLYITAASRVNDYDINLLLQGPAKTSAIKMTSVPPLAENEIISLLALGVTSSKLDQNIQSKDQAAQTGYEIGAVVLSRTGLNKNLKNKLGVDFQLVPHFDSTKNTSVLKATISKQVTEKIQASAAMGNDSTSEVKLQYLFNKNLSTVGSWEGKEAESIRTNEKQNQSVFGLDLEFKKEFR